MSTLSKRISRAQTEYFLAESPKRKKTGGEMLDPEQFAAALRRLYTPTPGRATRGQDTWWPLAGAGLVLFLADLVLRNLPRKQVAST